MFVKKTFSIMVLIALGILLLYVLGCGIQENESDENSKPEHLEGAASIFINEGPWPIEGYAQAVSGNTDSSFDYPDSWNVYSEELMIGQEVPRVAGSIDIYILVHSDEQQYFPRSEIQNVEHLSIDSISGIPVYDAYYYSPSPGVIMLSILARDPRRDIQVYGRLASDRSIEEYLDVIDRIFGSMQLDFDTILELP